MALFNANIIVKGRARLERNPYQENVINVQVDATLDPGASPAVADRYVITDSGNLHANFGSISGLGDGDIVEFENGAFVVVWDASVNGEGAQLWVEATNKWYQYNGSVWATLSATVSIGNGLTGDGSSGSPLVVLLASSAGLKFSTGQLAIEPNDFAGTGLEDDGSDKLRIASAAAGNGLTGGSGSALAVLSDATGGANLAKSINVSSNGLAVKIDDSTVNSNGSNQLQVKDAGISAAKLASDSVTTVKILDANVTAAKLASDSVTTVKIVDANVTAAKLASDSVTTVKILDANVTTGKLADSAVTAAKLASDAVTTVKILDANVTAAKLASDSVTTVKIVDANVTTAKLANDSVDRNKLDYADTALRSSVVTWLNADGATKIIAHNYSSRVMVEIVDTDSLETVYIDKVVRTDSDTLTLTAISAPATSYEVYIREVATRS